MEDRIAAHFLAPAHCALTNSCHWFGTLGWTESLMLQWSRGEWSWIAIATPSTAESS